MSELVTTDVDGEKIVRVTFSGDDDGCTVFTRDLFHQLKIVLEGARYAENCRGIILHLGDDDPSFVGYPIADILAMDQMDVRRYCLEAQEVIGSLSSMSVPTFGLIQGNLSGPALEIALACRKRIMSVDTDSGISFPEIRMGIIPALGGLFTLVGHLGVSTVLDLYTAAEKLDARKALDLEIVDYVTRNDAMHHLAHELTAAAEREAGEPEPPASENLVGLLSRLWSENRFRILADIRIAVRTMKKTRRPDERDVYLSLLEMLREGYSSGFDEGLMVGARNFTDLVQAAPGRNRLSLVSRSMSLRRWMSRFPKPGRGERRLVNVIGSSRQAVHWTVQFARKGIAVRVVTEDYLQFSRLLQGAIREREMISRLIYPTAHRKGLGTGGLVVVAPAQEDPRKLGKLTGEISSVTDPSIPIILETSSLPCMVSEVPLQMRHRVYGVSGLGLGEGGGVIEVALGDSIQEEGLPDLMHYLIELEPLTIVVRESPLGLCERIRSAYLSEAMNLVDDGASIVRVEEVALQSGIFPGPFLMMDDVGLGRFIRAVQFLRARFGERFDLPESASVFQEMGIEGRSGEKGFYHYEEDGHWIDESLSSTDGNREDSLRYDEVIRERLVYSVVGEALRAFGEGVSTHPEVIDCAVHSLGIFPAHLGGPLQHASKIGTTQLIKTFDKLYRTWGVQFEPPDFLFDMLGEKAWEPARRERKEPFFLESPPRI